MEAGWDNGAKDDLNYGNNVLITDTVPTEEGLEGGELIKKSDRVWIFYALGAGLFFSLTNVAIQEINDEVGILCSMYLSVGAMISSSVYFFLKGRSNV